MAAARPRGARPRTGKYRYKARNFNGTYTQAKAALREFIDEIERGRVQDRTDYTYREYAEEFLEGRKARNEVTPNTLNRQQNEVRMLYRHIGGLKLEEIAPETIAAALEALASGDSASGKPISDGTLRLAFLTTRQIFEDAKKKEIIVENPCKDLKLPFGHAKEKKAMSAAKAREFVESLDPTNPRTLSYLIAVTTGMRCGEVCGLSWQDVDFEEGLIYMRHSYDQFGNLKDPKTGSGRRVLPLSDFTAKALKIAKAAQRESFERLNAARAEGLPELVQDEATAVVTNVDGQRARPDTVAYWWRNDRVAFGLSDFTFHELRHTYLTLLAEKGVHPKVMQELAGHSKKSL